MAASAPFPLCHAVKASSDAGAGTKSSAAPRSTSVHRRQWSTQCAGSIRAQASSRTRRSATRTASQARCSMLSMLPPDRYRRMARCISRGPSASLAASDHDRHRPRRDPLAATDAAAPRAWPVKSGRLAPLAAGWCGRGHRGQDGRPALPRSSRRPLDGSRDHKNVPPAGSRPRRHRAGTSTAQRRPAVPHATALRSPVSRSTAQATTGATSSPGPYPTSNAAVMRSRPRT